MFSGSFRSLNNTLSSCSVLSLLSSEVEFLRFQSSAELDKPQSPLQAHSNVNNTVTKTLIFICLQNIEIVKYGAGLKMCELFLGWENKINFTLGVKFLAF